jgi:hypothetical protein
MNISLVLLSVFEYPACTDPLVFFRAGNDTPLMLPAGKKSAGDAHHHRRVRTAPDWAVLT